MTEWPQHNGFISRESDVVQANWWLVAEMRYQITNFTSFKTCLGVFFLELLHSRALSLYLALLGVSLLVLLFLFLHFRFEWMSLSVHHSFVRACLRINLCIPFSMQIRFLPWAAVQTSLELTNTVLFFSGQQKVVEMKWLMCWDTDQIVRENFSISKLNWFNWRNSEQMKSERE